MVCWKTHQGVLENTSICARKRNKMLHTFYYTPLKNTSCVRKHTFLMKTHHAQVRETQLGVLESTPCFWYVTKQKYEEFHMVNINDI